MWIQHFQVKGRISDVFAIFISSLIYCFLFFLLESCDCGNLCPSGYLAKCIGNSCSHCVLENADECNVANCVEFCSTAEDCGSQYCSSAPWNNVVCPKNHGVCDCAIDTGNLGDGNQIGTCTKTSDCSNYCPDRHIPSCNLGNNLCDCMPSNPLQSCNHSNCIKRCRVDSECDGYCHFGTSSCDVEVQRCFCR